MFSLVDIRKVTMVLFIGVVLVVAAIPICQMLACDQMASPMPLNSPTVIATTCAALVTGALSSSTVGTEYWRTTLLKLVAAAVVVLAVLLGRARIELSWNRSAQLPPQDPLGVRILI